MFNILNECMWYNEMTTDMNVNKLALLLTTDIRKKYQSNIVPDLASIYESTNVASFCSRMCYFWAVSWFNYNFWAVWGGEARSSQLTLVRMAVRLRTWQKRFCWQPGFNFHGGCIKAGCLGWKSPDCHGISLCVTCNYEVTLCSHGLFPHFTKLASPYLGHIDFLGHTTIWSSNLHRAGSCAPLFPS